MQRIFRAVVLSRSSHHSSQLLGATLAGLSTLFGTSPGTINHIGINLETARPCVRINLDGGLKLRLSPRGTQAALCACATNRLISFLHTAWREFRVTGNKLNEFPCEEEILTNFQEVYVSLYIWKSFRILIIILSSFEHVFEMLLILNSFRIR